MKGTATLFLIIPALALAACGTTPDAPLAQDPPPLTDAADAMPSAPAVPVAEVEEQALEPYSGVLPPPTPQGLLGLGPAEIRSMLGDSSLERVDGPVRILQFANGQCVLDIYFYETEPGQPPEASYLAARTPAGEEMAPDACYPALVPGGALSAGSGPDGSQTE